MNQSQLNVFAETNLDHTVKLTIVWDLERVYSSLLRTPSNRGPTCEGFGQPRASTVNQWNPLCLHLEFGP